MVSEKLFRLSDSFNALGDYLHIKLLYHSDSAFKSDVSLIATPQTAPLREIQPDGSRHPFDQFIIAKTPAERWGNPDDLGGPAVFLASDASNFVNGHVLYVDGGILAYIGKQP